MSWHDISKTLTDFWSLRDARERRLLALCAGLIVAALYYLLLIAPAIQARARLARELPVLHQQVAQLQALSNVAAELNNKAATPVAALTRDSLAMALAAHGLQAKRLDVSDQTVQLALEDVSYTRTLALLAALKQDMRVQVVAARFNALEKADRMDATLTLQQAGQP